MDAEQALIERDIDAYLERQEHKQLLRLLTCGSVDDGKSTLIGRLLHDTRLIYEDQLAAIKRDSEKVGTQGGEIDLALLVDGLQAEREQGITIDVAYRYFSTARRKFIIADTPGHEQYTRNMATGASTCDLAVILIDARYGVLAQTRRHSFICALLGIRHVVVAINKMDLVDWSEETFERIRADYSDFSARLDIDDIRFVPISALRGDNVVSASENMPWYRSGPLLDYLETVHTSSDRNLIDLRLPVQYVNRPDLDYRGYAGTVASGILRPGDEVEVLPSRQRSRVSSIDTFDGPLDEAFPPLAVTVTLEDEIDISRGDMLVHPGNQPRLERAFECMLVWMADTPMRPGTPYFFKHATSTLGGTIEALRYRVDVNTLHSEDAAELGLNEVGRCRVSLSRSVPFDAYRRNRTTGAFVVIDRVSNNTVGAGMIVDRRAGDSEPASFWEAEPPSVHLTRRESRVSDAERAERWGHRPATLLLTGLTASGKSTLARALERRLFDDGRAVLVLDGENMRLGISRDLGFGAPDRSENLRRAAEVARLANRSGLIAICAFVAPDADARTRARETVGSERFLEVHLSAPLETCRERDSEGRYDLADRGEINLFPGVSAPYEIPEAPDLEVPTHELDVEACVDALVRLLEQRGILS